MELSPYVEGLRRELGSLTRFASDDVVQVAGKLAEALESSVRLTLLEVLSAAAAEITTRLDDTATDGVSVNSWLAHAAIRALESSGSLGGPPSRRGVGQRITGYARS